MFRLKIILANGHEIILPRCYYTVGGEKVAKQVQMASGKIVQDVIGTRKTITGSWDYIPAADLKELVAAIRGGGFLQVEYLDVDNEVKQGYFLIDHPQPSVFKYKDDIAVWTNVTLKMSAQEVE